jgi:hypothetical protein
VINSAEKEDIGVAAGMVLILRLIGMTIGISLMTAWALTRYKELVQNVDAFNADGPHQLKLAMLSVIHTLFVAAMILAIATAIPAVLMRREHNEASSATEREISRLL